MKYTTAIAGKGLQVESYSSLPALQWKAMFLSVATDVSPRGVKFPALELLTRRGKWALEAQWRFHSSQQITKLDLRSRPRLRLPQVWPLTPAAETVSSVSNLKLPQKYWRAYDHVAKNVPSPKETKNSSGNIYTEADCYACVKQNMHGFSLCTKNDANSSRTSLKYLSHVFHALHGKHVDLNEEKNYHWVQTIFEHSDWWDNLGGAILQRKKESKLPKNNHNPCVKMFWGMFVEWGALLLTIVVEGSGIRTDLLFVCSWAALKRRITVGRATPAVGRQQLASIWAIWRVPKKAGREVAKQKLKLASRHAMCKMCGVIWKYCVQKMTGPGTNLWRETNTS